MRGQVLAYLLDVKTSTQLSGGKQGFQLAFVFAENPYFSDRLLTKTYLMDPEDEDECLERAAGCQINWKEGMNVTVKLVQKEGGGMTGNSEEVLKEVQENRPRHQRLRLRRPRGCRGQAHRLQVSRRW